MCYITDSAQAYLSYIDSLPNTFTCKDCRNDYDNEQASIEGLCLDCFTYLKNWEEKNEVL